MPDLIKLKFKLNRRPHGGLKEILRAGKAPRAKVVNPADGKPPPRPKPGEKE